MFRAVILEAFLWGLGTAIGELPPYFVAKAAAISGKKDQEFEEFKKEIHHKDFFSRAKAMLYKGLRKHAFIVVLLFASIPNPLFDLAGLTCGHFMISFATFFGATIIGKAVIKVSIQCFFVIILFSKHHIEHVLSFIEGQIPSMHGFLSQQLEK